MTLPSKFIAKTEKYSSEELGVLRVIALGEKRAKYIAQKSGRCRSTIGKNLRKFRDDLLITHEIAPRTRKKTHPTDWYVLNPQIEPQALIQHIQQVHARRGWTISSPLQKREEIDQMTPQDAAKKSPSDLGSKIVRIMGQLDRAGLMS